MRRSMPASAKGSRLSARRFCYALLCSMLLLIPRAALATLGSDDLLAALTSGSPSQQMRAIQEFTKRGTKEKEDVGPLIRVLQTSKVEVSPQSGAGSIQAVDSYVRFLGDWITESTRCFRVW
jgi:hypothetical protein